jgi:predicted nucleic acid-binding protein
VRLYLDASVIVALLIADSLTARAEACLSGGTQVLVVSDFAGAEFASAVAARRVRMRDLTEADARAAFSAFDAFVLGLLNTSIRSSDVRRAQAALRRLNMTLRAPDALNIMIAQRVDAVLLTFDIKMAASARALGLDVVIG